MSEEIKVGEYVRLKRGEIFKIDENTTNYYNSNKEFITNEITKHSKNIIDLIEVGDYVNGSKVIEIDNCKGAMRELYIEGQNPDKDCGLYFEQIENIVTHEQFKEMEYKV